MNFQEETNLSAALNILRDAKGLILFVFTPWVSASRQPPLFIGDYRLGYRVFGLIALADPKASQMFCKVHTGIL
jgi:hypothetical protein